MSSRRGSDERVRPKPAPDPLARCEGELRRRHRGWRRPRPLDRVLPGDPTRHHECRGHRGRLHRLGQHRPQYDHHPRQLRDPRGRSLLPALPRDVPGPGGGDGRRDPSPDQGHLLAGAHGDGDAHGARAVPDEHGLWGEDGHGHASRAQGTGAAGRPHRGRPLPGVGCLASPGGRDGQARPGRLGLRGRRVAAWRARRPAHPRHRPPS